jgi:hypothetical protein
MALWVLAEVPRKGMAREELAINTEKGPMGWEEEEHIDIKIIDNMNSNNMQMGGPEVVLRNNNIIINSI